MRVCIVIERPVETEGPVFSQQINRTKFRFHMNCIWARVRLFVREVGDGLLPSKIMRQRDSLDRKTRPLNFVT